MSLKKQHRHLQDLLAMAGHHRSRGRLGEAHGLFERFAARACLQMDYEEKLLLPLYDADGGDMSTTMIADHNRIRDYIDHARRHLQADDEMGFADTAQVLLLQFVLHASREERVLAGMSSDEHGDDDDAAYQFIQLTAIEA